MNADSAHSADEVPAPIPRASRAEVRRRLLDSAEKLFAERGYAESKLADIARAAGFTTGAVYSNFGSKHELFVALLQRRSAAKEDISSAIVARPEPKQPGRRAAEVLAERLLHDLRWQQLAVEFTVRAGRDPEARAAFVPFAEELRQRVARIVVDHVEKMNLRMNAEPEIAAVMVIATVSGLVLHHAADPDGLDRETLTKALTVALGGLAHP